MRYREPDGELVELDTRGAGPGLKSAIIRNLATVLRNFRKTLPEKCHSKCVRISYSEDSARAKRKNADSNSTASALGGVQASRALGQKAANPHPGGLANA
jgi:hypothetical protein